MSCGGALTHFSCKLGLKNIFFHRPGRVQVHPLHPLATPMHANMCYQEESDFSTENVCRPGSTWTRWKSSHCSPSQTGSLRKSQDREGTQTKGGKGRDGEKGTRLLRRSLAGFYTSLFLAPRPCARPVSDCHGVAKARRKIVNTFSSRFSTALSTMLFVFWLADLGSRSIAIESMAHTYK